MNNKLKHNSWQISLLIIVIGMMVFILGDCTVDPTSKKGKNIPSIAVTDTLHSRADSVEKDWQERVFRFKYWLRDTLKSLNDEWMEDKTNGIISKSLEIGEDSIGLWINVDYKTFVSCGKRVNNSKKTLHIIELLEEYDELPSSDFELSFREVYECTPSMVDQLVHGYYSWWEDIKTFEPKSKTTAEYDYIRGRLSGKTVIKPFGKNFIKQDVNFIWRDDKLIKNISIDTVINDGSL